MAEDNARRSEDEAHVVEDNTRVAEDNASVEQVKGEVKAGQQLRIVVWDYDKFSSPDLIGFLDVCTLPRPENCKQNPDVRSEL